MGDHEVLRCDRRARAHLASPPGPRPGPPGRRGARGRGRPASVSATRPAGTRWPIRPGTPQGCGRCAATTGTGSPRPRCCGCCAMRGCCWRSPASGNAASSRPGARPRSPPSRPGRTRCGSWTSPSSRPPPAARGGWPLPGLLEQVRAGLAHLPDGQPARRDRRGRAGAHRGRPAGRPRRARRAGQCGSAGHHRDRQRRAVPLLPVRGWGYLPLAGDHRHPPRAAPRPHPGEDARVRTAHASAALAR
jgi:hypothetical protein